MKIYLAGPIFQSSDEEAKDWREEIKKIAAGGIEFLDPMSRDYRGRVFDSQLSKEIVEGDKEDIRKCDVVIANVSKPSAGTSMEILFAWQLGIPVITIAHGKLSPWILYHSYWVVDGIESALKYSTVRK